MPKVPSDIQHKTPAPSGSGNKSVTTVTTDLDTGLFSPSIREEKLKAKFWQKYKKSVFSSPESLTAAEVAQVTKSSTITHSWSKPGFKEWFINKDEQREKIEYLFSKGLSAAEGMLLDPETNANAKVNLIKMLAEMTGYLNKGTQEVKFADEEVNKMSSEDVKEFLRKRNVKVVEEQVLEVSRDEQD